MAGIVLNKNDLIINPKSQRAIKVGSKVWRSLVNEGLVSGVYRNPKHLGEYEDEDDLKVKKEIIRENLPKGVDVRKGVGAENKGKLIKYKKPSTEDAISQSTRVCRELLKNNPKLRTVDDDELNFMVMKEISKTDEKYKKPSKFQTKHVDEEPEGEDSEDSGW